MTGHCAWRCWGRINIMNTGSARTGAAGTGIDFELVPTGVIAKAFVIDAALVVGVLPCVEMTLTILGGFSRLPRQCFEFRRLSEHSSKLASDPSWSAISDVVWRATSCGAVFGRVLQCDRMLRQIYSRETSMNISFKRILSNTSRLLSELGTKTSVFCFYDISRVLWNRVEVASD